MEKNIEISEEEKKNSIRNLSNPKDGKTQSQKGNHIFLSILNIFSIY